MKQKVKAMKLVVSIIAWSCLQLANPINLSAAPASTQCYALSVFLQDKVLCLCSSSLPNNCPPQSHDYDGYTKCVTGSSGLQTCTNAMRFIGNKHPCSRQIDSAQVAVCLIVSGVAITGCLITCVTAGTITAGVACVICILGGTAGSYSQCKACKLYTCVEANTGFSHSVLALDTGSGVCPPCTASINPVGNGGSQG